MSSKQDDFESLFQRLYNYLQDHGLVKDTSHHFKKLITDHSRVAFFQKLLSGLKEDFYLHIKRQPQKSTEESQNLRRLGNEAYKNKDLIKALSYYTKCIKHAPYPQKENESGFDDLAFGYANRSAVMYELQEYYFCAQDIENSIKYGYPDALVFKLWERKAKCLKQLKSSSACIKHCIEEAMKYLRIAKVDETKKKQLEESFQQDSTSISNGMNNVSSVCDHKSCLNTSRVSEMPQLESINSNIPSASEGITINFTEERGRFVEATRDIKVGELLCVEKPYASILLPKFFDTHCHYCLRRTRAPIPCGTCTTAQFCNEKCRRSSWSEFHEIECDVLDTLATAFDGSIARLAFRIVIVLGSNEAKKLWKEVYCTLPVTDEVDDKTSTFYNEGVYDSADYRTIYDLIGHSEDRSISDLFNRTAKATYLLQVLKKTKYFDKKNIDNDFRTYVGSLILRHLQNLPCNAHSVDELEITNTRALQESLPTEIAGAAYSLLSLLNHCCDPNVVRHSYGGTGLLRAIRPIKQGEEVLDNYGFHFATHTKPERQKSLKSQYYFTCTCYPCLTNWPLYDRIPDSVRCLPKCTKSEDTKVNCEHCIYNQSKEKYDKAVSEFLSGATSPNDVLNICLQHIEALDNFSSVRPWRAYSDCQEVIKQCFAMQGNCYF